MQLSGSVKEVILYFSNNVKLVTWNQHEKSAKHPLVFVSRFKMIQKHYSRRLTSSQIICSSVNFLSTVTAK